MKIYIQFTFAVIFAIASIAFTACDKGTGKGTDASNEIFSQNRNPLAYTSWEPRSGFAPGSRGVERCTIIDFDEDTFVASHAYGTIYGKYTVSESTVIFASAMYGVQTGRLSGGRLFIGRATFYRL